MNCFVLQFKFEVRKIKTDRLDKDRDKALFCKSELPLITKPKVTSRLSSYPFNHGLRVKGRVMDRIRPRKLG